MKWFGPYSWGAPICNSTRVEVPAGERCVDCGSVIFPHDRGFMIPLVGSADDIGEQPWHYDCLMRAVGGPDWEAMVGEPPVTVVPGESV